MPRTTSERSGEQSSSAGKHTAGRRLAKAPSSRAQPKQSPFGPQIFRHIVERRASDSAQQDSARGQASLQSILRQRITAAGKRRAADVFFR